MSSGSESDDDYVPEEPEKLSEEESADEETEKQTEKSTVNEVEKVKKKRQRSTPNKTTKKAKLSNDNDDEANVGEMRTEINPEQEKKREEDLWTKFLEGTDSKPKPKTDNASQLTKVVKEDNINSNQREKVNADSVKDRERRIFEFAGETIVVENNVIKERAKSTAKVASVLEDTPATKLRSIGGLSSIVGQLNKKNKLSTLEKSKLDWNTYKKEEGIDDEITSHNKGKAGYLDRQDFLTRADVRQYEIERDLRLSKRSNR